MSWARDLMSWARDLMLRARDLMSWEEIIMSWERDKYFFHMSPQCCRIDMHVY